MSTLRSTNDPVPRSEVLSLVSALPVPHSGLVSQLLFLGLRFPICRGGVCLIIWALRFLRLLPFKAWSANWQQPPLGNVPKCRSWSPRSRMGPNSALITSSQVILLLFLFEEVSFYFLVSQIAACTDPSDSYTLSSLRPSALRYHQSMLWLWMCLFVFPTALPNFLALGLLPMAKIVWDLVVS